MLRFKNSYGAIGIEILGGGTAAAVMGTGRRKRDSRRCETVCEVTWKNVVVIM